MRYVCLGYMNAPAWESLSLAEREAFRRDCRAYDDVLADAGCVIASESLDCEENAATLRVRGGAAAIEPGCPSVASRMTLVGILVIKASDMNHAIQLAARYPASQRGGVVEVRPAATAATAGRIDGGEKSSRISVGPVETARLRSTS
ncbi:YciI family protein [Lacipirellula limnantheis]|uniref:YCII-related domain protein n=1 Tax=Lacipirellula limnantheis TaxID=2528024 RepID=A0A517TU27_9BACT|nr:YciI family protein [Lacipirellula limnantheis]QDT71879.1 YCII-related domain protein [Lacipirellula limnantheis]